jgi:hypothetical protein
MDLERGRRAPAVAGTLCESERQIRNRLEIAWRPTNEQNHGVDSDIGPRRDAAEDVVPGKAVEEESPPG